MFKIAEHYLTGQDGYQDVVKKFELAHELIRE